MKSNNKEINGSTIQKKIRWLYALVFVMTVFALAAGTLSVLAIKRIFILEREFEVR